MLKDLWDNIHPTRRNADCDGGDWGDGDDWDHRGHRGHRGEGGEGGEGEWERGD